MFLEELKNVPDAQIIITYEKGRVVGFIQSELQISGGNEYTNPLDVSAIQNIQRTIRTAGAAIEWLAGKTAFTQKIVRNLNYSFQFAQQSTDDWIASEKPIFSIDLTFVAENEQDDVRKSTEILYRTVYPELKTRGIKGVETPILTAPLGYKISAEAKALRGTIAVRIGRWFKADRLVMRKVSFSYSKEVIASGAPLYAYGRVEFQPYVQPDVETFLNYFSK